ncbi:MAG TPA: hypothetical protein HA349_02585 [Methanotrichaceae archaeon]|nr:hypothetical protein [Methanotrichaceae archaeon]
MYKRLIMVFAIFLLSVGMALADETSEEDMTDFETVEFTGVAFELNEPAEGLMGAPTVWAVEVSTDEEGTFCSEIVNVTVFQATPGPWGTFDENITGGDIVEVYGAFVEDETRCIAAVTLQGSEEYYFELADEVADEVVEETEVAETEDAGDAEDEVVEETEDGEVIDDEVVVEETEEEDDTE